MLSQMRLKSFCSSWARPCPAQQRLYPRLRAYSLSICRTWLSSIAHLRGGEYSTKLIAQLNEQNVPVIVLTGSPEFPPLHVAGTMVLEKPVR